MKDEIVIQNVSYRYPEEENWIFTDLSLNIPKGVTSVIGQNGTGKTTLLLLAAGVLLPQTGEVFIRKTNTKIIKNLREKQKLVSFVYQNMEFETEDSVENLLHYVYENGFHKIKKESFLKELMKVFELESIGSRKTQEISKGELQRTILAFSLLYGSQILLLDEPIFALEEKQKHQAMEYLTDYAQKNDLSILYSAHELDITEKYSEYLCLFFKDRPPILDKTELLFSPENLEAAYSIPFSMLKQKEHLYRDILLEKRGIPQENDQKT